MKYYLAIDIGASFGRHIVGWQENGELLAKEVYRFPNGNKMVGGYLTQFYLPIFTFGDSNM